MSSGHLFLSNVERQRGTAARDGRRSDTHSADPDAAAVAWLVRAAAKLQSVRRLLRQASGAAKGSAQPTGTGMLSRSSAWPRSGRQVARPKALARLSRAPAGRPAEINYLKSTT